MGVNLPLYMDKVNINNLLIKKMKTALQKLLDEFSALPHIPISRSLMIHLIKKQMPQEKQQIVDAANQTEIIGKDHLLPGEEYYEKKYNSNELI